MLEPENKAPGSFVDFLEGFWKRHPTWRFTGAAPVKESKEVKEDFQMRAAHDEWDAIEPPEETK